MAVYTQVSAEAASALLAAYDVGKLTALKGIAEGVENSNYLVETDQARFILTLYENRVDPGDLPYFHDMLAHLHAKGCRVPRFIEDRDRRWLQDVAGRKACLIEFLSGVSVSEPDPAIAGEVGMALGQMHAALADFSRQRINPLGLASWRPLFEKCDAEAAEALQQGLSARIAAECDYLEAYWPDALPQSAVHADLFPDNVLILDGKVTGLIDFYFACSDSKAYDLAVTHSAWSFSADGSGYQAAIGNALVSGYSEASPLNAAERAALPILARGACLRFLLTRLYDWINTPAGALVSRKDPLAFLRRLDHYSQNGLAA
jgi:homoserine kinase type II